MLPHPFINVYRAAWAHASLFIHLTFHGEHRQRHSARQWTNQKEDDDTAGQKPWHILRRRMKIYDAQLKEIKGQTCVSWKKKKKNGHGFRGIVQEARNSGKHLRVQPGFGFNQIPGVLTTV